MRFEQQNERRIRLWPEGAFYKVYERSAYLFVSQVRPYQVRKSYVEATGHDVVSTAFPRSVVETLGKESKPGEEGCLILIADAALDDQQFWLWRDELPIYQVKKKPADVGKQSEPHSMPVITGQEMTPVAAAVPEEACVEWKQVMERLREFNLAMATPMQCMLLVSELQAMLNEGNGH